MPEFGDFMGGYNGLELAVRTSTPRKLGQSFRIYRAGEYDDEQIAVLLNVMYELIFKHHGPVGAIEFMQEATR